MRFLSIFFLFIISVFNLCAQDTIIKRNGEEIQAKVLNINETQINYIKWNNQNGPTYTIAKSDVFMIKYENGEKDVFGQTTVPAVSNPATTPNTPTLSAQLSQNNLKFIKQEDMFKKGKRFKRGGTAWMIICGVGMLGTIIGVDVEDWGTGAVVGFATGEAEAMSVASLSLGELSFRKVSLSPGISVFSDRHSSAHALGIGASIHF